LADCFHFSEIIPWKHLADALGRSREWVKSFREELDARALSFHVLHEQQVIKSLPIKGLVGMLLAFEQFLAHMGRQARTLQRLRSLQERIWRAKFFCFVIQSHRECIVM
jgi:hypothetical protein